MVPGDVPWHLPVEFIERSRSILLACGGCHMNADGDGVRRNWMEAPPGSPLVNLLRRWWKLISVAIAVLLALVAGALYYHFADMQFSLVPDSVREFGAHLGASLMEKRLVMWGPEMYEAVASRARQDADIAVASQDDDANRQMPKPIGEPTKAEKDEMDRLLKSQGASEDKRPEAAPAQVAAVSPPKAVTPPSPPPKAIAAVGRPSSPAAPVKVAEHSARSVQSEQAQALPANAPAGSQLVHDVVCKPPKHRFVDFDRCRAVPGGRMCSIGCA